ncbi:MAG: 3-isopropylmalate dehydratase large subunit [Candidatus Thermoplasmatota archaeon]|nr:3-isopropylmalate dehydratase large subunit [Candidatus Thermoplasmatota archaeon]
MIQKIFEHHSNQPAQTGTIIDVTIDTRVARDFGGANVVKNLQQHNLSIHDATKTFFTFDCNPGGCDQKYAANQHICRLFAREHNITIFDINDGIGTHLAIDQNFIQPGGIFVSTDSHANILGAIGAFGQGMGDIDIAHTFAYGKTWFKVPPTIKITLIGTPKTHTTPKDIVLKIARELGANGLLGYAAELYGTYIDTLDLSGRITIASMATEMGAIIMLFPPNQSIIDYYRNRYNQTITPVYADHDATYTQELAISIQDLPPQISRPGHPEDVVDVTAVEGTLVDSGFIGSCTNGRLEDLRAAARILKGKKIAPGRILKIVPATDAIWKASLEEGLITIFKEAGALIGSAGCAGCAAGQIGQTGQGEIAISTGNRNFHGKQGKGDIYLSSPETVAASLIAGYISSVTSIPKHAKPVQKKNYSTDKTSHKTAKYKTPTLILTGRAWVIAKDNIDTDMIYHNRYLSITTLEEMGQYTFDNLKGYENFAKNVKPGDIIVVGKNFGCGSSRQHAVDCFKSLGVSAIIAESFGAIYERNAINSAMPILTTDAITTKIKPYDVLQIDLTTATIKNKTNNTIIQANSFSIVQQEIYLRGGLLEG